MVKIYTKFGDKGQTVLFDGTRVAKDHWRIETYGTVDELNSAIGVAIVDCRDESLRDLLTRLQQELLDLGRTWRRLWKGKTARKCAEPGRRMWRRSKKRLIPLPPSCPQLKRFILPGGGITAARPARGPNRLPPGGAEPGHADDP